MLAVKVQYTVTSDYAERNRKNIEKFMAELKQLNNSGIKYSSFVLDDGNTFVHFAMYPDEETQSVVANLESFKYFQMKLRESKPTTPPNAEPLTLVASAYDIF